MIKLLFRFLIVLVIINVLFSVFTNFSYGNDDWVGKADGFLEKAENSMGLNKEVLRSASSDIYNIFTSVGMVLSVIVGIALGIIYMMSSAVNKAEVKEKLIPFLIGSFVIFEAFGIWKIAINTLGGI